MHTPPMWIHRISTRSLRLGAFTGIITAATLAPLGAALWPADLFEVPQLGPAAVVTAVVASMLAWFAAGRLAAAEASESLQDARIQGMAAGGIASAIGGSAAFYAPMVAQGSAEVLRVAATSTQGDALWVHALCNAIGRVMLFPLGAALLALATGALLGMLGARLAWADDPVPRTPTRVGPGTTATAAIILIPFVALFVPHVGQTMGSLLVATWLAWLDGDVALGPVLFASAGLSSAVLISVAGVAVPVRHLLACRNGLRLSPPVSRDPGAERLAQVIPAFWALPALAALPGAAFAMLALLTRAYADGRELPWLRNFGWVPVVVVAAVWAWHSSRDRAYAPRAAMPPMGYTLDASILAGAALYAICGWQLLAAACMSTGVGPAIVHVRVGSAFELATVVSSLSALLSIAQLALVGAFAGAPAVAFGWVGPVAFTLLAWSRKRTAADDDPPTPPHLPFVPQSEIDTWASAPATSTMGDAVPA